MTKTTGPGELSPPRGVARSMAIQAPRVGREDDSGPRAVPNRPAPSGEAVFVPDLLHPVPVTRVDFEQTKLSVGLAFVSGVSGGLFNEALAGAHMAPSTFEPASFVNDLFLQTIVAQCFKIRVGREDAVMSTT
ncbi:MAG TPA: hypothetical protein VF395_07500, partial [Polyangiaceae bacterium]